MMSQMGGGSPFEMMQKMMAQMGHSESKPSMEKMMGMCMGMCAEMLTAIRTTAGLAVSSTPELQSLFAEWLKHMEDEAVKLNHSGTKETEALASALKINEARPFWSSHQ